MDLGRFGWHPDPAVDFCVEVDGIERMVHDVRAGYARKEDLKVRIFRAMQFRVGGDVRAVEAKGKLRGIELAL